MSEKDRIDGFRKETLHAYHDGELSGFRRRRFERVLRRSAALRAELDQLASLRDALREHGEVEPAPDLWDAIALRLPAADARLAEAAQRAPGRAADTHPGWWLKSLGALAATAAVAWIAFYGSFWPEPPAAAGGVVRWIDTGERSVMVLDDDPETTIIWVFDSAGEGARSGGGRDEV